MLRVQFCKTVSYLQHQMSEANPCLFLFSLSLFVCLFVCLFVLRERVRKREREHEQGSGRESQAASVLSAQSLTWGSNPQPTRSRAEPKSRVRHLTNLATQVPLLRTFLIYKLQIGDSSDLLLTFD